MSRHADKKPAPNAETSLDRIHRIRIRLVFWALLIVFGVVAGRLVLLQGFPDDIYTREENFHEGTLELNLPRGDIYDRNGRLLATDRRARSLYADPSRIPNPCELAATLSDLLSEPENEVLARLTRSDSTGRPRKSVPVRRWLSAELVRRLEGIVEASKPGLSLKYEPVRFYPEGTLAAHVIGFVNRERVGSGGVEMLYDRELGVRPGKVVARVDSGRRPLQSRTLEYVAPQGGADMTMTIDIAIQHKLEQELAAALERSRAEKGMGLVMEPQTGAILALACLPTYNPNEFTEFSDEERKNAAITDVFEPGSSFKIVTAAAAIELGLVTPSTRIDCEGGAFNPYGHRIRDYHKLGVEPFHTCFAESSNIAMIKVAAMLGEERLEQWIRRFGFGRATSPDFGSAESAGIFRGRGAWSRLSMGSLPMGQEISVTLPQMARAFAVIANGGYLVEPYLVARLTNPDGTVLYEHRPGQGERVLSPRTAEIMKNLCHEVVLHGTGEKASIAEYRVGGKTGTAQVARTDGRGYAPGKYNTVFAGFAPVAHPRVVTVIVVREPAIREHWGGFVCGPVFREVVRDTLIRMSVPLDPVKEGIEQLAWQEDADPDTVMAEDAPGEVAIIEPDMESILADLDGLELIALPVDPLGEGPVLPDFRGMTKRQARERIAELGLMWDIQGSGWVAEQEPPPGTPLAEVTLCRLRFSNERKKAEDETQGTVEMAKR
ncbi:MAG TPA: penicillin-binding protein [Candidatus Hydrogenedentes bacterium]|jgi:cell division protein FtsI (penicillin-binding protein 3)|nr:penicillin-binding protein [Candidatus Hydrogenedentota bacterium]